MILSVEALDRTVVVRHSDRPAELHEFSCAEAAERRARFVAEALTWVGTPFVDCGDVKGPKGGVDCAMMLTRASVDTGLLPPFDPRPYAPRHMMHSSEEKFLGWLQDSLGAREVEVGRVGDVAVWQFGRCFCHGGVLVGQEEVLHAYYAWRVCTVSRMDEPLLTHQPLHGAHLPRPVKFFELWGY